VQITGPFDAVPAPELFSFGGIFSESVCHNVAAACTSQDEHALHLVPFQSTVMFLPDWVAVLTDCIAHFTEGETAENCMFP